MTDPIKAATATVEDIELIKGWLITLCDKAMRHHFGIKGRKKRSVILEAMGGIPGVIEMLASLEIPKTHTPTRIDVQAPFFQETTHKGREALKATVVIEIMCLKEGPNGQ